MGRLEFREKGSKQSCFLPNHIRALEMSLVFCILSQFFLCLKFPPMNKLDVLGKNVNSGHFNGASTVLRKEGHLRSCNNAPLPAVAAVKRRNTSREGKEDCTTHDDFLLSAFPPRIFTK